LKRKKSDIVKSTLDGWLRTVIYQAHKIDTPELRKICKVSVHEIRALSSSVAFKRNISIENIARACTWRAKTTFISFYLRDFTLVNHDFMSLPPVVAAQHLTH